MTPTRVRTLAAISDGLLIRRGSSSLWGTHIILAPHRTSGGVRVTRPVINDLLAYFEWVQEKDPRGWDEHYYVARINEHGRAVLAAALAKKEDK